MIVTIDGPAGSGKSTAARELAKRLGFDLLDTGAMYRAVAWRCLRDGIELRDQAAVAASAVAMRLTLNQQLDQQTVFVDDRDVTSNIRMPEVSHGSSIVASNPEVRQELGRRQREFASGRNIVTEGRDQGTAVFPHAECKFYITAAPEARAARRQRELREQHEKEVPLEDILQHIRERDDRDKTRIVDPLRSAEDAIRIDSTGLSPEQVVDQLEQFLTDRMRSSGK